MRGILRQRRRRKRKLLSKTCCMLLFGGSFLLCCLVFSASVGRSLSWENLSGKGARSPSDRSCDPSTLPSSIQLHCEMYRNNIITGSLCAPLCDSGHICDVTSMYGNAHKEVMVARCEGFCSQGQSEKAVLKHDEVYAASEGYAKFYSRVVDAVGTGDAVNWMESLKKLLHRHLPNSSITELFLVETLRDDSSFSNGKFSSFAFYNTFTQLFRQKEYVLFQAYRNTGIFPKVYGYCGPLYLVEFCDPVLKQDRRASLSFVSMNNPHGWNKATGDELEDSNQRVLLTSQPVPMFENHVNADSRVHQTGNIFDEIMGRFLGGKSNDKYIHQSSSSFYNNMAKPQTNKFIMTSETKGKNSGSEHVYVVNLNPGNINRESTPAWPSWADRVRAAVKIFRFLEYLEREDTFTEHIHLCDPKLEHFAVGRDDGKLKLIDGDLLLFDFNMAADSGAPDVDTGACTEHKECSDVMCTGWCWKEKGRCTPGRFNNNLQGVCENVFLHPSLEYGDVFAAIPTAVYDDVNRLLCECATNVTDLWEGVPLKMPSAAMRQKLVQVFEGSLSLKSSPDLRIHSGRGSGESDFLSEFCKSFELRV